MGMPRPTWQFYVAVVPTLAAAVYSLISHQVWPVALTALAVGYLWHRIKPIGFTDDPRYQGLVRERVGRRTRFHDPELRRHLRERHDRLK